MFGRGWYNVKWFNKAGDIVKNEDMFLTTLLYRREEMKMQTAFLQGKDVARMTATPIEKN